MENSKGNTRIRTRTDDRRDGMQNTTVNYRLVSEEINLILSNIYGGYISESRPTKKGGLRFLDIVSNKTFGFEKTRETDTGNLLILSAPFKGALEDIARKDRLEKELRGGPHNDQIYDIVIRQSRDRGKEDKLFVEVKYILPTGALLESEKVLAHAEKYKMANSRLVVKNMLKDYIGPFAQSTMDHLIGVIRSFK
jgi:hypothetical protein